MPIVQDIIEGASMQDTLDGLEATRLFQISELEGPAEQKMFLALLQPGIPQILEAHPAVPLIKAVNRSVAAQGASTFLVTITYKVLPRDEETEKPQIDVGANVQQDITNKDFNGDFIKVLAPGGDGSDESMATYIKKGTEVTVEVNKLFPQTSITISRKETVDPLSKSRRFTGKVNGDDFLGDPKRFWLITRISGNSSDGGLTFNVVYEFQRNENTWDTEVTYVDKATNEIPSNVSVENGSIKKVQIYVEENFSALDLDLGITSV